MKSFDAAVLLSGRSLLEQEGPSGGKWGQRAMTKFRRTTFPDFVPLISNDTLFLSIISTSMTSILNDRAITTGTIHIITLTKHLKDARKAFNEDRKKDCITHAGRLLQVRPSISWHRMKAWILLAHVVDDLERQLECIDVARRLWNVIRGRHQHGNKSFDIHLTRTRAVIDDLERALVTKQRYRDGMRLVREVGELITRVNSRRTQRALEGFTLVDNDMEAPTAPTEATVRNNEEDDGGQTSIDNVLYNDKLYFLLFIMAVVVFFEWA